MDVDLPSDLIESAKMAADVVRLRAEVAENDALLKRIHREGVIEGLTWARHRASTVYDVERIQAEIERLRAEQKEG